MQHGWEAHPHQLICQQRRQTNGCSCIEFVWESSEDDDDLDFEVARNIFRKAENSLAVQDHLAAKALFQEGLIIADNLSVERQSSLTLGQVRMRYADCCSSFANDLTGAEDTYQKVMEERPVDTATLERIDARTHPHGESQFIHCQALTTGYSGGREVLSTDFEWATESAIHWKGPPGL